jgi:hypothetical protein
MYSSPQDVPNNALVAGVRLFLDTLWSMQVSALRPAVTCRMYTLSCSYLHASSPMGHTSSPVGHADG